MPHHPIDYDRVARVYDLYVTSLYDLPFFRRALAGVGGRVLELMSGTGRLSLPLIEDGVELTCVDRSPGMLAVLREKLQARGLAAETICADVSRLELPAVFERVLLPFQSVMEIVEEEDRRRTLAAVRSWLVPGGRFLCTAHNPAIRRHQVDGLLRVVGRFPVDGGSLVVSGFETGGDPVVERLQFFEHFDEDGVLLEKLVLPMEFSLIERGDFEAMAEDAGFEVLALYGHYDRSGFDPERSPVMIWELG